MSSDSLKGRKMEKRECHITEKRIIAGCQLVDSEKKVTYDCGPHFQFVLRICGIKDELVFDVSESEFNTHKLRDEFSMILESK